MFRCTLATVLLLMATPAIAEVPTQINHQGVVSVDGIRFDGQGQFMFAIVNDSGQNLWTYDNTEVGAINVPSSGIPLDIEVGDGVYSVLLGSGTMPAIEPSIFAGNNARLRIWFNDGQGTGWQQLEWRTCRWQRRRTPIGCRMWSWTTRAMLVSAQRLQ